MATAPQEIGLPVNQITRQVIGAAMKVHSVLGPGLLESAYHACLLHEIRKCRLRVDSQVGLPVIYEGEKIDLGYRIDLIVGNVVIVEVKCVDAINPIHHAVAFLHAAQRAAGRAADQLQCRSPARRDQKDG